MTLTPLITKPLHSWIYNNLIYDALWPSLFCISEQNIYSLENIQDNCSRFRSPLLCSLSSLLYPPHHFTNNSSLSMSEQIAFYTSSFQIPPVNQMHGIQSEINNLTNFSQALHEQGQALFLPKMDRGCLVLLVLAVVIIGVHSQSDSLGKTSISSIYVLHLLTLSLYFHYYIYFFQVLYLI